MSLKAFKTSIAAMATTQREIIMVYKKRPLVLYHRMIHHEASEHICNLTSSMEMKAIHTINVNSVYWLPMHKRYADNHRRIIVKDKLYRSFQLK